ncbi:ATP-binding protein, partial [Nonomuraea sp. NPDC050310]|uniref:ATP-binding protein n=1 Tax=Nonomuraea sp. NPDC050310 TaxID=3154935 RepID=UPI0033E3810A
MRGQPLYIVCAQGEEPLAERLAEPLREAGYEVTHSGTVEVGESQVGTAARALSSGAPIVLCATTRAVGSAWAHQIVNAGHSDGDSRVFVVQMEKQAYVEQLAVRAKVARYHEDPAAGLRDLLQALAKRFPPVPAAPDPAPARPSGGNGQYLDEPSPAATPDHRAIERFRGQLREEAVVRLPAALSPAEFLARAEVWSDGRLTRAGALLFGVSPTAACSSAMVKCVRYYGLDRSARRDIEDCLGPLPDQIVAARAFVARHVRRGERPSAEQAEAAPVYDYPMIAVREVIANAVVHRDYSRAEACVHVRVFDDRLEISSPGDWLGKDLPEGEPQELTGFDGQSLKRNYRLAHLLSLVRLVEGEGSGIPSALRDCRSERSPTPAVAKEGGFITVTLWPCPPEEPPPAKSAVLPLPADLPPGTPHFVGRQAELDALLAMDTSGAAPLVTVISGMGGSGKTALALHFARIARERFPDGQLYADLGGGDRSDVSTILRRFLLALGADPDTLPEDVQERAALFRGQVAGRRMLVLLDNAGSEQQVQPLLPGTPGPTVLVTSRRGLPGLAASVGARQVSVADLPAAEAVELLARRLEPGRAEAEPEALAELARLCGHLPLALAIVAARASAQPLLPLAALADDLRDTRGRLNELQAGDLNVRAVFSLAYGTLTPAAARMFRLLGLHPGPEFSAAAAAALAGLDLAEGRAALHELRAASLLGQVSADRYRLHELLRSYAREESLAADHPEERRSALLGMLDHYIERVSAAEPEWLHRENHIVVSLVAIAAAEALDDRVGLLAQGITPYLDQQGRWRELRNSHEIALAAAERLGDHAAVADARSGLGLAYAQLGRFQQAVQCFTQALTGYERLGDRGGAGRTRLVLSELLERHAGRAEAASHAELALTAFRAIGDRHGEARALTQTATLLAEQERYSEALALLGAALELYLDLNDVAGEARVLEGGQILRQPLVDDRKVNNGWRSHLIPQFHRM